MWHSVESLPTFTSVERLKSCSFAKQNTYYIYILQKWVNRPLNLILSESSQFFCANRPVRFFARIVPVESSQGGTGLCAKRPVTLAHIMWRACFIELVLCSGHLATHKLFVLYSPVQTTVSEFLLRKKSYLQHSVQFAISPANATLCIRPLVKDSILAPTGIFLNVLNFSKK